MFNYEGITNDKSGKLIRYVGYSYLAVIIFVVLYFFNGFFFTKYEDFFAGNCYDFNDGWELTVGDERLSDQTFPLSVESAKGQKVTAENTLPTLLEDKSYLSILTGTAMKIYVDGELRLEFDGDDNPIPGGYVKSHYILMELSRADAGRTVTIVREGKGSNGVFNAIHIGDKQGLTGQCYSEYGTQFALAVLLVIFSVMVIVIGYIMLGIYKIKMPIIMLGYGTLLAGLWFIFDSFLFQVLFGNYYADGPMEYMLLMIFPYYFIRYLNYEQQRRHENLFTVVCAILMINFILETLMHFTGAASYQDNLILVDTGVIIAIGAIMYTLIKDIRDGYFKSYRLVGAAYLALLFFGVLQALVMILIPDNHGALLLMLSMYILLVLGVISMLARIGSIEEQANYAKHANELKSSFLANMSHEIRTPINAIMGMNEMILRESKEQDIHKYSEDIKRAGNNLLDIINDILDFSKIESGKMDINVFDYRLSGLLHDVDNLVSIKAKEKKLTYSVEVSDDLPDMLKGDEARIRQILLNVLNNAVKYTDEGRVVLRVSAIRPDDEPESTVPAPGREITLHFEIEDTGIGIKEEDRGKLFNIFERLDLKKNRSIEGTGLGLAITYNLIELMGGRIDLKSEYEVGTTFYIDIPQKIGGRDLLKDAWRQESQDAHKYDYVQSFTAPEARILVVDDIKINITVIRGLLKKTGVQIDEALSGPESIEKVENNYYDLILMDHMMPQMDGIETLHELKRRFGDLCPVIALTANAIEGMREMYLEAGFADYLSKPVNYEELEKSLREYIPKGKQRLEQ